MSKITFFLHRGVVFRELHKLYIKYAVPEYMQNWPELVKYCGYREDNLPQLQDISVFLKRKTGFQLRPVAGYLYGRMSFFLKSILKNSYFQVTKRLFVWTSISGISLYPIHPALFRSILYTRTVRSYF
jgi:phenylalanine-4-hydroxylase